MRRILLAAMLAVGLVAATACQPTEPAMTITAKSQDLSCLTGSGVIAGKVTPNGTDRVVLQRTVNGKWVDWKWTADDTGSGVRYILSVPVVGASSEGDYYFEYALTNAGARLTGTIHLRVRSDGGTRFSPGIYVKMPVC